MFEYLDKFDRVLVTGPQRSGTTIVARMIEHDTALAYIDEQEFRAIDDSRWRELVSGNSGFVMQCPGMCRYVDEFGQEDDVAVVMCHRNIDEIIASEERIDWGWELFELMRYGLAEGVISRVKYDYWNNVQQAKIKNPLNVYYHTLVNHPLWIPAEKRQNFKARQWRQ